MGRLRQVWKDNVWGKIIAQGFIDVFKFWIWPGIIGVVGLGGFYFAGWWPKVFEFLRQLVLLALSSSLVPNWALLILGILAALYIIKIGRLTLYKFKPKKEENEQTQELYRQDLIFDISWYWTNMYGKIIDLLPCCPKCNYQLSPKNKFPGLRPDIVFNCDHCNCVVAEFTKPLKDIHDQVYKEIQRKLRTNNFPTRKTPKMKLPSYGFSKKCP